MVDNVKLEPCQTPKDPIENFADFLGKYTILLNGTTCEKQANQPLELTLENRREVVEKFKILLNGVTHD